MLVLEQCHDHIFHACLTGPWNTRENVPRPFPQSVDRGLVYIKKVYDTFIVCWLVICCRSVFQLSTDV